MKILAYILSVLIIIFIFIQREKIKNKKFILYSIIFYFVLTAFMFALKKLNLFEQKLLPLYVSAMIINVYIFIIAFVYWMIQIMIAFHKKVGNEGKPLISKFIKNSYIVHFIYSFLFLLGCSIALYGIWLAK